jgi:hypothetical protein
VYPSGGFGNAFPGILTTAGKLLFTGDPVGQPDRLQSRRRQGALAPAPQLHGEQRTIHIPAGRQAIPRSWARATPFGRSNWPENEETTVITRRQMLAAAGSASRLVDSRSGVCAKRAAGAEHGWAPGGLRRIPAGSTRRTGRTRSWCERRDAWSGRGGGGGRGPAFDFLGYFHSLGFGVAEGARPASNDPADMKAFRARVEQYHMRVILDVGYPRDENGVEAFDANVKMAKEAGAISLHAAMTAAALRGVQRLRHLQASFERNQKSIALAEPILRKYQMRLGSKITRAGARPSRPRGSNASAANGWACISISATMSRSAKIPKRR